MNKKVDEKFIGIKDIYQLQCLCTELKEKTERLEKENERYRIAINEMAINISKAIEYIEKESWFCYKDNEEVIDRTPTEELLDILKGGLIKSENKV